MVAGTR
jgi:hypothetical protein